MSRKIKRYSKDIAVVGAGYWGVNVIRNLYELGVLHTVCDKDSRALKRIASLYKGIEYTTKFSDLLISKEIGSIAISTPAATHFSLTKKALLSGKDVFVEKPLSLTTKQGQELVGLAKRKKRILMVGHILCYHPAVIKLREMIKKGELGKVQYIYSNRLNIGKLRTEENILWSFAPHDISAINMLVGSSPFKVSAFGGDYLNKGIHDTTLTTLEFKNGVKGHIFVSWLHPYKEQKIIIVGSKAMAVFDDMSKEKLFVYPHRIVWTDKFTPIAKKAKFRVIAVKDGEPLKRELEHFIKCILTRKKPETDGSEGLEVLRILERAQRYLHIS